MNGIAFSSLFQTFAKASRNPPETTVDARVKDSGVKTAERNQRLTSVVETEIIPRLMLAHSQARELSAPESHRQLGLDEERVKSFAAIVLKGNSDVTILYVTDLLDQHYALESIYLDLFAPTAALLGKYWEDDVVSYSDVTLALGHMQQLVREISSRHSHAYDRTDSPYSALFAPSPGEQHIFGLVTVEDHFRRAGWRTWIETRSQSTEISDTIEHNWFDAMGFSLSDASRIDGLRDLISLARSTSKNSDLFIIVGGGAFVDQPELVARSGADAAARDGQEALTFAHNRVCQLAY